MIPTTVLQHNHFHLHNWTYINYAGSGLPPAVSRLHVSFEVKSNLVFYWLFILLWYVSFSKLGRKITLNLQSSLNSCSFHWQAVTCTVAANSWNPLFLLFRGFGNTHSRTAAQIGGPGDTICHINTCRYLLPPFRTASCQLLLSLSLLSLCDIHKHNVLFKESRSMCGYYIYRCIQIWCVQLPDWCKADKHSYVHANNQLPFEWADLYE